MAQAQEPEVDLITDWFMRPYYFLAKAGQGKLSTACPGLLWLNIWLNLLLRSSYCSKNRDKNTSANDGYNDTTNESGGAAKSQQANN